MKIKSMLVGPAAKPNGGGLQDKLKALMVVHNHLKRSGRGNASYRSQEARAERIFHIFRTLTKELRCGIEDPHNLRPAHIEKLVAHWVQKGLSASTIENNLSVLRLLASWINKDGMVKRLSTYDSTIKRTYAATKDKSWSTTVEDPWVLWDRVYAKDPGVAKQLLLGMAFGARRKEMVAFKPFIHIKAEHVEFYEGTKGGRPRVVPITTEFQQEVAAIVKEHVLRRSGKPQGFIGNPDKTFIQNLWRFDNTLRACGITKKDEGVTAHGLRADYANNELAKRGLITTIRGGSGSLPDKFATKLAFLQVSEALGHSRVGVMTAYGGPMRPPRAPPDTEP
jgi:integrase